MLRRSRIQLKTREQIRLMRRAGLVVHSALEATRAALAPGVRTADLDEIAADVISRAGAVPSFLGYGHPPFPGVICASVNSEVVHGIPSGQVLAAGDIVSIDCGAIVEGWHGDAAYTAIVGEPRRATDTDLVATTERALWAGIAALAVGERLGDVGAAVEDTVGERWGIVEGYTGHGIGTEMHQAPHVLNHRARDRGPRVRAGLCVAVEPMLTVGSPATRELDDGWTVVTADGSRAAHAEHTVAVLDDGLWVLTAPDGGAERLGALGVPVSALAG